MLRKLLVAAVLSISAASFASQAVLDTSGLSDAQVAELKAHAASVVASAAKEKDGSSLITTSTALPSISLAATWGSQAAIAAEGFAKAIGIAAKELGVTVNDFLHTDAGKLTAAVIIWKIAGAGLLKIIYGMFIVITGLAIARMLYMRLFTRTYEKVEYSRLFGMFKGTKMVRVPKTFAQLETDGEWFAFWVLLIVIVASVSVGGMFFTV